MLYVHILRRLLNCIFSEGAFHGLMHLEEIILSHNRIRNFHPEVFTHLTSLRQIWLDQNAIEVLG